MTTSSTLSSKGQIVIPAAVRTQMGVRAGTKIEFVESADGWLLKPVSGDIKSLRGVLRKPAKPVTVEDMRATVRERAASQRAR